MNAQEGSSWRLGFGVRSEAMILCALIWLAMGLGIWQDLSVQVSPGAWHLFIPAEVRSGLWVATGAAALALAFFPMKSHWGLTALIIMPIMLASSYLWAWIIDLIPGEPGGDPRGWFRAIFFVAMVGLVVVISHIPANVPVRRR